MRVDSSHTAPWSRVADLGQRVGWQGRDLPPGQAKKQAPAADQPAPAQPAPTTPDTTIPDAAVPGVTAPVTEMAPEVPPSPQIDVFA